MQYTLALLALAASACAQGVTHIITPPAPAPTGCSESFTGNFMINAHNVSTTPKKRGLEKRVTACGGEGTLVLTLQNGVLMDAKARTGYIADNRQFQFDGPPQAGAIYTAGFSVCSNDTLALGGSTVFYQCLSGNFYNLYDQSQGGQCNQAYFEVVPCVVAGGTTITASTMSTLSTTIAVMSSPTVSTQSASHTSSTTSSTMTTSLVTILTNATITASTRTGTATASGSVLSSATATATGTTATSPAISTGAASIPSSGKEFAALAAGFAALVMM